MITDKALIMTSYDSVPYPSYSHTATDPAKLQAIGKLFGVKPPPMATARILEIGCASGGNILPMAEIYPGAGFLGIDLSTQQIAVAERRKDELGLGNITFRAESVLDTDLGDQRFDYIIAHGVYSWVPSDVQRRILKICGTSLSQNGIAYVSYNTLPGWNGVKTVRDMMLFHGANFSDPAQKVTEARNMLAFVAKNIQSSSGPYKQILEQEIKTLQNVDNSYLLHDHLEAVNEPCYFHQFANAAAEYGLIYLGESNLPSMYVGNQADDAVKQLGALNDPVRQEQYMDFITNRRFRSTLMVRNSVTVKRAIDGDSLTDIRFSPHYRVKTPVHVDAQKDLDQLELVALNNSEITGHITGRVQSVAYLELLKAAPKPLLIKEIVHATIETIGDKSSDAAGVSAAVKDIFVRMIFNGLVSISSHSVFHGDAGDKPRVLATVRNTAKDNDIVTNVYHAAIKLDSGQRIIIQSMDGTMDLPALVHAAAAHGRKGELTFNLDGNPVLPDDDRYRSVVERYVTSQIDAFTKSALIV